jgi:hypothetical protein
MYIFIFLELGLVGMDFITCEQALNIKPFRQTIEYMEALWNYFLFFKYIKIRLCFMGKEFDFLTCE